MLIFFGLNFVSVGCLEKILEFGSYVAPPSESLEFMIVIRRAAIPFDRISLESPGETGESEADIWLVEPSWLTETSWIRARIF